MVTETKETMNKAFDTMNSGFRTAVDCGQRTQETWTNFMRDTWKNPGEFERVAHRSDRMMKQFFPFVTETMEMFTRAYDANVKAGKGVFKAICETAAPSDEANLGRKTRQIWDATFEAMRSNFDVMTKVSAKTLENYSAFCETAFADDTCCSGKPQSQPTRPTNKNEKSNGH